MTVQYSLPEKIRNLAKAQRLLVQALEELADELEASLENELNTFIPNIRRNDGEEIGL